MRGLLSALWSFLQHPAAAFEDHLTAVEETIAGAEHRLEEDIQRAIHGRIEGIHARLEVIKKRVVEDLKRELHRVLLILALVMACAALALIGTIFGLMATWTYLEGLVGAVDASLVLAIVFLLGSLVVFGLLNSVLRRSQPPPVTQKTAA
jgi:hypothetical protein